MFPLHRADRRPDQDNRWREQLHRSFLNLVPARHGGRQVKHCPKPSSCTGVEEVAPELLCSATKISRLETRRPHRVAWVTKGSDHHVLEVPTQARRHTETSGLRLTEAHAEAAAAMGANTPRQLPGGGRRELCGRADCGDRHWNGCSSRTRSDACLGSCSGRCHVEGATLVGRLG